MKLTIVILIMLICFFYSCQPVPKLKIIPLSPYKRVSEDTMNNEKWYSEFYAINVDDIKNKKIKKQLDDFVFSKIDSSIIKNNKIILIKFYKYKIGELDENYRNSKFYNDANIDFKQDDLLFYYEWVSGHFMGIQFE